VTQSQPARQNRKGHPCPPWCITDHDEQLVPGHFTESHGGETVPVEGDVLLSARACMAPAWDGPRVQVSGRKGSFFTEHADQLAGLIEQLASAPPERHLELAAAIRQAAAQITAPPPEESAKCPDHRPVLDSGVGWYCAACGSDAPPVAPITDGGQS
jgi:hypothetical protein